MRGRAVIDNRPLWQRALERRKKRGRPIGSKTLRCGRCSRLIDPNREHLDRCRCPGAP